MLLVTGEHPRVVADMMGHVTSALTERLYQQVAFGYDMKLQTNLVGSSRRRSSSDPAVQCGQKVLAKLCSPAKS